MSNYQIPCEISCLLAASLQTDAVSNNNVDFAHLQKLIRWHGIRPVFLSFSHRSGMDFPFLAALKAECQHLAINNLLSVKEMTGIAELLDEHGIRSFAYKGGLWADWLYGNAGQREFGDIDLLIKSEDFTHAVDILKLQGYLPDPYREYLLQETERKSAFFRTDYHIPLENPSKPASNIVEAHWQVAYPRLCFDFPDNEWEQFSKPYKLNNSVLNAFTNEYQFLLLLVHHGGKEQWSRIKYIADFASYMKRYGNQTDWHLIEKMAKQKGIFKLYTSSIAMLRELGLPWNKEWPQVSEKTDLQPLVKNWNSMPKQSANSTWRYFVHGLSIHDGMKFKALVISAHLKYFTEAKLLLNKARWYSKS